jgi:hypothetical protein
MIDHADKFSQDIFVSGVELPGQGLIHVFAVDGKFDPNLGFRRFPFSFA